MREKENVPFNLNSFLNGGGRWILVTSFRNFFQRSLSVWHFADNESSFITIQILFSDYSCLLLLWKIYPIQKSKNYLKLYYPEIIAINIIRNFMHMYTHFIFYLHEILSNSIAVLLIHSYANSHLHMWQRGFGHRWFYYVGPATCFISSCFVLSWQFIFGELVISTPMLTYSTPSAI